MHKSKTYKMDGWMSEWVSAWMMMRWNASWKIWMNARACCLVRIMTSFSDLLASLRLIDWLMLILEIWLGFDKDSTWLKSLKCVIFSFNCTFFSTWIRIILIYHDWGTNLHNGSEPWLVLLKVRILIINHTKKCSSLFVNAFVDFLFLTKKSSFN